MTQAHTERLPHPAPLSTATPPTQPGGIDHIRVDGVSHSYPDRRVLTNVSLTVAPAARLGLIGENGAGKSTLLRLIAGVETADAGSIRRPHRVGILWQEVQFKPSDTLETVLEAAVAPLRAIEHELACAAFALAEPVSTPEPVQSGKSPQAVGVAPDTNAAERYAVALEAAERAEVWGIEARRDAHLKGLGVAEIALDRRLDEVSGGQRSRVALAALLLQAPDALLLDEPTNHLDDEAAVFLEAQLRAWRGPVLFASHDRSFLDAVATQLLDLDTARSVATPGNAAPASGTTVFSGNYSDFLEAKASERERWERQHAAQQEELKRLKLGLDITARTVAPDRPRRDNDKMGYDLRADRQGVAISRRVRSAEQRYRALSENSLRKPPQLLSFTGIPHGANAAGGDAGTPLQARGLRVADRLEVDEIRVRQAERMLITGPNGAGKSTLLGVLGGVIAPHAGAVTRRKGLRIALLEQDVRFANASQSVREVYESTLGERRAVQVPLKSLGLIAARDENRTVGALSIGQQRRLALALIMGKPHHVFLLDEPTNHLSLSLATELEDALGHYPGAVVIASHDRWLRRNWTGTRVEMNGGRLCGGDRR